jgi:hypothetical protein
MNKTATGTEVQQRVANTFLSGLDLLGKEINLKIKDVGSHQTEIDLVGLVPTEQGSKLTTLVTLLYSYDTLVAISKLHSSVTGDALNYPTDEWPIPIKFYKIELSEYHETRTTSKHIRMFLERQVYESSNWEKRTDREWIEREAKLATVKIPIDYAAAITRFEIVGLKWN